MHFSQIGLSLGENLSRQILPKISAELIWFNLFCKFRAQIFTPKMGQFGFFCLSKITPKKNSVDHRHNYIKVSHLRSTTNFKRGIISKILYKLIYFCLIDKKGHFTK